MKTAKDPRHIQRIKVMQEIFSFDFNNKARLDVKISQEISTNLAKIDKSIEKAAPAWPISKINKVDLAILRQAVYELLIDPKAPSKVVIDEAVEIAKEYGSDSSPSFINGVLGKILEKNDKALD